MGNRVLQAPLNKLHKDKFRVILTLPEILKGLDAKNIRNDNLINLDSIQFSVYEINVPAIEVSFEALHYAGQTHNVTSFNRPPYPPGRIGFTIDNEFKNYWVIWKYLQLLNDNLASTYGGPEIFREAGGYPQLDPKTLHDYSTDVVVEALDEYNNVKARFKFNYAFITKLGEILYSFRDPDEIGCSFEFVFNQLDIELV